MLQPSLSLQIEFHTSNLFQMLLSMAACQFWLPLTQCLHKVFSPHSSGRVSVFSDSVIGLYWWGSVCKEHLLEKGSITHNDTSSFYWIWIFTAFLARFYLPSLLLLLFMMDHVTFCAIIHTPQLLLPLVAFLLHSFCRLGDSLHSCMAFPLLTRIDGVPGCLWEEKPSVSVSLSTMNNGCERIRWLNCFIWILCSDGHRFSVYVI